MAKKGPKIVNIHIPAFTVPVNISYVCSQGALADIVLDVVWKEAKKQIRAKSFSGIVAKAVKTELDSYDEKKLQKMSARIILDNVKRSIGG